MTIKRRLSLSIAQPPPREFMVGNDVTVRTSKLRLSPNYLYECFRGDEEAPFLVLISWPGDDDIDTALLKHTRK